MASYINTIPLILGSLLGVMLAVLFLVLLLFYKKRKESIEFKPLEQMTRGLKKMSRSVISQSQKDSLQKLAHSGHQTPILWDTQFWVPEVYNTIIQPSPAPVRKASRLQSTLDREIYSKALDTSYLQATDHQEVFDGKVKKKSVTILKVSPRESQKRIMVESLNRGMLNFSLQYKQDKAILYIVVIKADGLVMRYRGESCDPFVDIQVTPAYKRRMHSEVHQKTQNPVFNQQFEFEVPPYEIREQTVSFTVLNFNQQLAHDSIGSVYYKLDSLDHDAFFAGKEFTLWNKLEEDAFDEDKLDGCRYREFPVEMNLSKNEMLILLSVKYLRIAERLNVCVKQVRNLSLLDKKGKLDHPYVQVSLKHDGRLLKKLRTSVVKHDQNPVFNKNMQFEVLTYMIEQITLTVKVRHHNELGRSRTFAIIKIGKDAVGSGSLQWIDMLKSIGVNKESEPIERWHCLVSIEPDEE